MCQVRYFEVSESELEDLRERFTNGQYNIDIEHKTFSMAEYNQMLDSKFLQVLVCCSLTQSSTIHSFAPLHGLGST
jgi:hypothetical protein